MDAAWAVAAEAYEWIAGIAAWAGAPEAGRAATDESELFVIPPELLLPTEPASGLVVHEDRLLGTGGFTDVFQGQFNGKAVAVKVFREALRGDMAMGAMLSLLLPAPPRATDLL